MVSITVEAASARVRIQDVDSEESGAFGLPVSGNNGLN